ncbi:hypothetical protein PHSY_007461 [Pseudozyma hubeiensis SY62]|uniref:Uncharacterized protein n=1 Tax=Pseudozyma hubeiensis (strain SY62) TaxID=1305764 RepID=R9PER4_PSEHS|nr:hypothetical protein PHSY_007461 [Pseudozyma hubeiensis SY62]GAC99858.1 hypothetical protein PHSY_007461 [Pseudozyma hubeiensis SY62]
MSDEQSSPQNGTLVDTHITAILMGVVLCEILSFISFDLRLASSMFQKRHFHPIPISYLVSRYTMLLFISVFSILTIPSAYGTRRDETALHWLRSFMLPLLFTSTSAILGFRAVILHFSRPFLVTILVNTLLAVEFVSSLAVMILSVSESPTPTSSSGGTSISAAWICAPLLIALLIDLIFTLIVVIPILVGTRQRGEIIGMMLSDAIFFGVFSMVVKIIAIGLTIRLARGGTNAWLPISIGKREFGL